MIKRVLLIVTLLSAAASFTSRAQDAAAATTNAPAAAAPADTAPKPDPAGTATGAASDVQDAAGNTFVVSAPTALSDDDKKDPAKVKSYAEAKKAYDDYLAQVKVEPLAVKMADPVGHNRVAINFMWTLITGFLVMFMQAGFALVETGLCRAKNAGHTMAMNFMIYPMGMLGFYLCGFAFMFGGLGPIGTMGGYGGLNGEWTVNLFGKPFGLLGHKGFLLQGVGYDTAAFALFLFQMVFMDTTATIPTGAAAERWKFSAFMIYGCCIGTFMYPIFGNWVWGGGWLSQLGTNFGLGHGHVDFAGSSVVHMQGGVIALIFAWLIGPRYGKYDANGKLVHPIIPHNLPFVMLGTFILAFGWFGFNPGSSLAGTDLRIAVVAVNTMLASATGALGATLWMWWVRTKKPDPSMMCNGMLAGLVAITCPCAFVSAGGASILGLVAGILVVESVFFFDKIGIDDCVGAISVHGVNGAWGCLSLGLFADGTYGSANGGWNGVPGNVVGLFYGGGMGQFWAELIGVTVCFVTLALISLVVYKLTEALVGNRVDREVEIEGLDLPEMGVPGYSGFVMDKQAETPMPRGEAYVPKTQSSAPLRA
ncbi:MAG TPA: ammonium transporter [Verrucomicrobiae bacterium]|nr:ammonium transporter [Verrucomicrobiae bacterium]